MTATAGPKSSPQPALPPAPPPAVASSPPRPMRPLAPSQIGLAEHVTRHHVVTLPAGTPLEHVVDATFWGNISERLRPCDRVDVHDAGGRFFIELIVRQVAQSRPTSGVKGGALMHVLRHVEFDPIESKPRPVDHEVKFLGPAQGWCVVRLSDGKPVAENLADRETAEKHLAGLTTAAA
jgi:hypothetical protein